jgi:hypothetical protein
MTGASKDGQFFPSVIGECSLLLLANPRSFSSYKVRTFLWPYWAYHMTILFADFFLCFLYSSGDLALL